MITSMNGQKHKKGKVSDAEDRISKLPDEILTHILSFLETKQAIRTGILSTRWKSVWTFVPTIDLNEWDFYFKIEWQISKYGELRTNARERLLNFVDKMLLGRSVPSLDKVAIKGSFNDSWISAFIQRNVRKLELEADYYGQPRELPQSLFSCNKLVALKLGLDIVLNIPGTSIYFPNLKALELWGVIYANDNSAKYLISSCPVLEDLAIYRCKFDNLETLNVTSQSLKRLLLNFVVAYPDDCVFTNVICASALEFIELRDNMTKFYVLKDLSSVIKAVLHISCSQYHLLDCISTVKHLTVICHTSWSPLFANSIIFPTFCNLTRLELHGDYYPICCKVVLELLNNSPVLEVLIFKDFFLDDQEEHRTSDWDVVPKCLLSHLKIVKIDCGWEVEAKVVTMVKYFLKNAKVLDKLTFERFPKDRSKFAEELLSFPKDSKACQI